ncbi:MAG: rhodanese-like domain-containing protein [Bacteroidota bacterium]
MSSKTTACKTPRWRLLKAQLNHLSPIDFKAKMEQHKDALVIDVRTPDEFANQHLVGAINISYFAEDMWEQLEALPSAEVYLIYCRSGRRSIRVCTLMKNGGFQANQIFNLEGGILAWNEATAHLT